MSFLPFWAGGVALAAIVFLHYAVLHSQLAVSGRITALVNRLRDNLFASEPELSEDDMLAAVRAMTAAEFGADAVAAPPTTPAPSSLTATSTSTPAHLLFFAGLVLGGFVAARAFGAFVPTATLSGERFAAMLGSGPLAYLALFGGGILVGIGTRMSGGCTSGHGLIGVPRLERGSLLATAAFFGTGIVVSIAMEALR